VREVVIEIWCEQGALTWLALDGEQEWVLLAGEGQEPFFVDEFLHASVQIN